MTAMEKVAWTELTVSLTTLVIVTALIPWLGNAATGAFGLLGLLAVGSLWFTRGRGKAVIIDERDREIEQAATRQGVGSAWMVLFLSLIAIVFWSSLANEGVVATWMLTWLVWLQITVCYSVKGLVAIVAYRSQNHGA